MFPPPVDKSGSLKQFVQTVWSILNTTFLLGVWNLDTCQAGSSYWNSPHYKYPGHQVSNKLSGWKHLTRVVCHNLLLGELSMSHVVPLGEDHWQFMSCFLKICPMCFFKTSANFALYSLAVINHSHEYNHMLSHKSGFHMSGQDSDTKRQWQSYKIIT